MNFEHETADGQCGLPRVDLPRIYEQVSTMRNTLAHCFAATAWLSSALMSLQAQTPDRAQVRAAIDARNAEYIRAYAQADARALAAVYDDRGARLSRNGQMARGRDAIAEDVGRFVNRVGPVAVTIETADLWVVDDLAYETGEWSYTYAESGEAQRTIGGRYVTVWRRQADGGWRMWTDMGVPGTEHPAR